MLQCPHSLHGLVTQISVLQGSLGGGVGPILTALETGVFECLVLLSDHGKQQTQHFVMWLRSKVVCDIQVRYEKLRLLHTCTPSANSLVFIKKCASVSRISLFLVANYQISAYHILSLLQYIIKMSETSCRYGTEFIESFESNN